MSKKPKIHVHVESTFLPNESSVDSDEYVFAYTVKISNTGDASAQLISRHWIITDANGETREVKGLGVIGQQPVIKPGDTYEYASHTVFHLPNGMMHGSYQMVDEFGTNFEVEIPAFECQMPRTLH